MNEVPNAKEKEREQLARDIEASLASGKKIKRCQAGESGLGKRRYWSFHIHIPRG